MGFTLLTEHQSVRIEKPRIRHHYGMLDLPLELCPIIFPNKVTDINRYLTPNNQFMKSTMTWGLDVLTTHCPQTCWITIHFCLQTNGHEARSRLTISGPQRALAPNKTQAYKMVIILFCPLHLPICPHRNSNIASQ